MDLQHRTWRLAAAVAYHLPGTALLVHNDVGPERLVAPTTTLHAALHPGELRDILGGTHRSEPGTALTPLRRALGLDTANVMRPEVITISPLVTDCGLGLYRAGTSHLGGTFAFVTPIDAPSAAAAIEDHVELADHDLGTLTRAGLGYDELLDVTMVVFEWDPHLSPSAHVAIEHGVRIAQSACTVVECSRALEPDSPLGR